jgi:hypothetical protein
MGELVWSFMEGVSAIAILYGAWLVIVELVRNPRSQSTKTKTGEPHISLASTAVVLPERRSGVERRSSERQRAQRIAA